ncbi:MAG TPA: ATP-binding protein [Candidatus Saccharimonadales bacterium]|nr:ATP-binding protein [Candidatus Saccharimonadales bacterium]
MLFIIGLLLSVGLLNTVVALAVLSRNVRRPLNIWFFALAASCAAWVFGIAAFLGVESWSAAYKWAQFFYIAPLFTVASSVVFAQAFPSGGKTNTKGSYAAVGGAVALAACIIASPQLLLTELAYQPWGKEIVLGKPFYLLYSAYLIGMFALTVRLIYRKAQTEKGLYRSQALIFLNGFLVSCILGVFFNLILPWFGNYQLVWLGPLASSFYLVATAYGIVRHRLFDVRIVAARAVGYVLSLLALGAIYGVMAFVVLGSLLGGSGASTSERAISAALAVSLALIFHPIKRFFDRITNRLFYRDAYNAQAFIDNLNHVLVSTLELDKLLKDVAQLVQDTLKAESCFFVISPTSRGQKVIGVGGKDLVPQLFSLLRTVEGHKEVKNITVVDYLDPSMRRQQMALQSADISIVGYIRSGSGENGILGYFMLGPKKSGNPYSRQDIKMCEVVVNELIIAIQNAMRFREIENFTLTLQQRIDEATRKLRRTNDKLRKLDETKDDFISMASHQLRTPLTSVKGYVSMVLDGDAGKITGLQRKLLTQSFISSQRMVYLISDLLNVSRLRTGKFIIEPVPTNLAKVVEEEVEQLVETAKGRNLELVYHKPEHFPVLMMDETKMRQVIMNFIDNAVHYTPSGGHIEVGLVEKPLSIEFTVVDDGIGVPKHEQHHLFTKFFRAHNAKRARPDGTGLGLFMAKKVIIAQGGATIFRSQENRGSTFGFTFAKAPLLPGTVKAPPTPPIIPTKSS